MVAEPSLPELESRRDRLYAQLSAVGDFKQQVGRRELPQCGKPNCACVQPGHPGRAGRGSCGPGPPGGAALFAGCRLPARWRRCTGRSAAVEEFAAISEQIAEVNEKICEARQAWGANRVWPLKVAQTNTQSLLKVAQAKLVSPLKVASGRNRRRR